MADYAEEYENETDEVSEPKGLRAQLEKALAENKELKTELQTVKSTVREKTVAEVLTAKGVNAKIAKFIPSDVDGEEALTAWLEENAEIFGFTTNETNNTEAPSTPAVDSKEVQSVNRLQNLNQSAQTPSKFQDIEARLANAKTQKEITAILKEAQQFIL